MTKKDPTKEVLQHVEEYGFYKHSTKMDVKAYMDKEVKRQKEAGIISGDADKISMEAARVYDNKRWPKIFIGAAGVVLAGLLLSAVAVCIIVGSGQQLPSYLGFLEQPIDYMFD